MGKTTEDLYGSGTADGPFTITEKGYALRNIDKITPRPGESVAESLAQAGVEDMGITVTSRQTYIAPFANADAPGILSPKDFLDELMRVRFPNAYLGDTSARIAVDISQMVGIRFGETIKAYVSRDGDAKRRMA